MQEHFASPDLEDDTMESAGTLPRRIVRARSTCLRQMTVTEQWEHISLKPRFLRTWFSISLLVEAIITAVVYIWGWAAAGQPFVVAVPAVALVAVVTGVVLACHFHGPIPHATILCPAYSLLKFYIVVCPFVQKVQNVRPHLSAC